MSRASQNSNAVVKSVCDLLTAHHIWHMRVNTGAVKVGGRFFRYGIKGAADVLATPRAIRTPGTDIATAQTKQDERYPLLIWVECKFGAGRQSAAQKQFQQTVEAAGHVYVIAQDGPESVERELRNWRVIR
ncbi:MAG: hypothetical protein L0312_26780 [Acidobacteria bacterium]|nr:hypothetical protein [Acidobacteriota bacterium]